MKLSSLLNPKLIKFGLDAGLKDEALEEMVEVLAASTPQITVAEVMSALVEREKLGPFSMANGIAFPHARLEMATDFRIALGTAPRGIDFKAPDGNLIRIIILFVIPKRHSNLYLTTLAQFLNLFAPRENLRRALQARTGEGLVAAIDSWLPGTLAAPTAPPLATVAMGEARAKIAGGT